MPETPELGKESLVSSSALGKMAEKVTSASQGTLKPGLHQTNLSVICWLCITQHAADESVSKVKYSTNGGQVHHMILKPFVTNLDSATRPSAVMAHKEANVCVL